MINTNGESQIDNYQNPVSILRSSATTFERNHDPLKIVTDGLEIAALNIYFSMSKNSNEYDWLSHNWPHKLNCQALCIK